MYKIVVYINPLNGLNPSTVLNDIPIKEYSNGSLVSMKNTIPWIDYCDVPFHKLEELLNYIDKLNSKDVEIKIKKKYGIII